MAPEPSVFVLVVGLLETVVDDAAGQAYRAGVTLRSATDLEGVRSAFDERPPQHVIMGAGLALEARLEIVREVFTRSDTTTVHMKDVASGPEGFLPFVTSVLSGLVPLAR